MIGFLVVVVVVVVVFGFGGCGCLWCRWECWLDWWSDGCGCGDDWFPCCCCGGCCGLWLWWLWFWLFWLAWLLWFWLFWFWLWLWWGLCGCCCDDNRVVVDEVGSWGVDEGVLVDSCLVFLSFALAGLSRDWCGSWHLHWAAEFLTDGEDHIEVGVVCLWGGAWAANWTLCELHSWNWQEEDK